MKIFFSALLFIVIAGCTFKSEKAKNNPEITNNDKELKFIVGLKTSKEDEFKIFLNNIKVDEFQTKNIQIKETVPRSNDFESIVAEFGTNNISNSFVFNLGNENEKEIILNGIELSYGENSVLVTNENFNDYFRTNRYVTYDSISNSFKTLNIDGKHNPALIARRRLMDLLTKSN